MPKKIILIRHGETEYNKIGKAQGQLDIPLNKLGFIQAKKVAQQLKNEVIDVIYSSDLKRPLQTIRPLAKLKNLTIKTNKKLRERHLGIFQN